MTLLGWITYAVLVSLILALAAWIFERALLPLGRPVRWVWGMALVGAVGLSFATLPGVGPPADAVVDGLLRAPAGEVAPAANPGTSRSFEGALEPLRAVGAELTRALGRVGGLIPGPGPSDRTVGFLWIGGAFGLTLLLLGATLRLNRAARRWPALRVHGNRVRITAGTGPAVIGIFRPWIVLPQWALGLGSRRLALILLHEREHISARDTLAVGVALGLVVTCFWNPALWWILQRLGGAMEMDCDRRVLARGVSRAEYGALLLDVGSRAGGRPLHAAAMAEPANLLERRLRQMRPTNVRHPLLALGGAGLAVALLLVIACETDVPDPTGLTAEAVEATPLESDAPAADGAVAASALLTRSPDGDRGRVIIRGNTDVPTGVLYNRSSNADETPPSPLIVLDGVLVSNSLNDLDLLPDRIESIEVVKGGAAEELYGSRGRNGVIHITTREAPPSP